MDINTYIAESVGARVHVRVKVEVLKKRDYSKNGVVKTNKKG